MVNDIAAHSTVDSIAWYFGQCKTLDCLFNASDPLTDGVRIWLQWELNYSEVLLPCLGWIDGSTISLVVAVNVRELTQSCQRVHLCHSTLICKDLRERIVAFG